MSGPSDNSGVKTITIDTPKGTFRVWTKRVGDNARIKLLLLHGGPGGTHEYFEAVLPRWRRGAVAVFSPNVYLMCVVIIRCIREITSHVTY